MVWIRSLESLAVRPVAGTEGTERGPYWSPDGRAFAYSGGINGQFGVWIQRVDPVAPVVPLGAGRVAWWSPR